MINVTRLGIAAAVLLLGATAARAEQAWIVQFRLTQWKTMHFSSETKAKTHLQTVQKLGCEAKSFAHDGHTDVRYRCPNWKQMKLATDEEAHKWQRWLKQVGFQTIHEH